MKRRFVLVTEPLTPEQERQIAAALPGPNIGWWHHLPNTWLIVDLSGAAISAESLQGLLTGIAPAARMFVTEVSYGSPWTIRYSLSQPHELQWVQDYWAAP
ncbi:MAG: hypothetical protein GC203_13280 [Phenylobacterium sp.]|uniref:hypothetical protein n=1 Tax=Phenylobacterium sp. TaxID=1871053 RepID=UPI0025EC0810|nr:hypothetical protein [Phenylobacterium sp.]MBI1198827.1 hypothetical protein [Phenylobacterium sp.]